MEKTLKINIEEGFILKNFERAFECYMIRPILKKEIFFFA